MFRDFLLGMARVLDFGNTFRDPRVDEILERTDAEALRSDWQAVGDTLRQVAEQVKREQK